MGLVALAVNDGFLQARSQHYLSSVTRTETEVQRPPWVRGWVFSLICVITNIFLYFSVYIVAIWKFKYNNHILRLRN